MRRWERLLLYGGLFVASGLALGLAREYRALDRDHSHLRDRLTWPHEGYGLPTIRVSTLEGDSLTIGEAGPGRRQLLFYLTTTCPHCRASLPAWNRIASYGESDFDVDAVGIALDGREAAEDYAREHDLRFPLVTFGSLKMKELYRANVVPVTVLVDGAGRVLYSRVGVLDSQVAIDSVLAAVGFNFGVATTDQ